MGQHKYNPVAIAAKEGKLPPKPKRMSKRERDAMMYVAMIRAMRDRGLPTPEDFSRIEDAHALY